MNQVLNFLTIGVADLEKMKNFYVEKFGWKTLKDSDGIVFFKINTTKGLKEFHLLLIAGQRKKLIQCSMTWRKKA